jgi:hypothetical protein
MKFQKERRFLRSLCKGHINDLIRDVGWSSIQCEIIRMHYLNFKTKTRTCMEVGLSETQYSREMNNILIKLISYLSYNKNTEISKIYQTYFS